MFRFEHVRSTIFNSRTGLLFLTLCLAGSPAARADFVVSNLSSSNGFGTTYWNLTGPSSSSGRGFVMAVEFTVSASTSITFNSAQLALAYIGGTNKLNISLMSNLNNLTSGTNAPSGVALETIAVSNLSATPSLVTATSTTHSVLAAGMSYWIVATYGASDSNFGWYYNSTSQTNHSAYRYDTSTSMGTYTTYNGITDPAFSLSGTPLTSAVVPTPSSSILVGMGGLTILTAQWISRRRTQLSIVLA